MTTHSDWVCVRYNNKDQTLLLQEKCLNYVIFKNFSISDTLLFFPIYFDNFPVRIYSFQSFIHFWNKKSIGKLYLAYKSTLKFKMSTCPIYKLKEKKVDSEKRKTIGSCSWG